MKIQFKIHRDQGSTFIACLCIALVTGILLASYLSLTHYQFTAVVRSEYWNRAITVSEAGVEDGLQLINKYRDIIGKLDDWTTTYDDDNWELVSNNWYHVSRSVGPDNYDAYVATTGATPVVIATANISLPYVFSVGAAPSPSQPTVARRIAVGTMRDPLFNVAMASRNNIDLNGKNIHTDSFDSSQPGLYADANGLYDPTKAKAGGDVVTDGQLTDSLDIGNATINGKVKTGPDGVIKIGDLGSVGDQTWTDSHLGEIQEGWDAYDMNVNFPSLELPDGYTSANWVPFQNYTNYAESPPVVYDRAILTSGKYKSLSLDGKVYVAPGVEASIYIQSGYEQTGSEIITIGYDASTDQSGTLTVYAGGNVKLAGQGVTNPGGNAENFTLYGLETCTQINFGGNASFTGVIYAPDAAFELGGGGTDTYDFVGSSITKSVKMNGHFNFHYDENLRFVGPSRGFIPNWWLETMAK
jgi:hypothetical protein